MEFEKHRPHDGLVSLLSVGVLKEHVKAFMRVKLSCALVEIGRDRHRLALEEKKQLLSISPTYVASLEEKIRKEEREKMLDKKCVEAASLSQQLDEKCVEVASLSQQLDEKYVEAASLSQ
uniref:Uncharacterized protein n=1 Tax=Chromera velia CCMP2878 TaxID=1169474 RepID=A0A0K6SA90_9ALVE|eukprot:Cvel_9651.t1-p1 / transcript=Cvel_9651.t1 / gene=Cvel_9651 / organism=Chromera_velia_CCMP2878 / gene_product=hypothetical protein / transcript_product=hypothetical protein / location=Cvel_scaffold561:71497-74851(-) / protein_length=119 / sequence_SO=supercontig / SO=protein_coding / is_pseudo=false